VEMDSFGRSYGIAGKSSSTARQEDVRRLSQVSVGAVPIARRGSARRSTVYADPEQHFVEVEQRYVLASHTSKFEVDLVC
jgi:hypothetical protein